MKRSLILIAACCLTACEQKKQETTIEKKAPSAEPTAAVTPEKEKSCCSAHPAPKAVAASDESIFQITSKWQDDNGTNITLDSLSGKVQVISMGYSTCKFACPRLLADLKAIEAGLTKETLKETGFAFFSIDPKTDTPARLREYRKENKLDPQRWNLFTASTPTVQELAVVLGIKYRRISDADFAHSNLIIVLNQKGEIVHRQEGLSGDPTATIKAIEALLQ